MGRPTTTTTTTVGNFSFSTSVGPYGPSTITTQRIDNQQFISGYSAAAGPITGHALEIGRNAFLNVNVGGQQWTGNSQSIGNFTFHNLYGSQGQMITGTSQRIGNFIFTTIR